MYDSNAELVTLERIQDARTLVTKSPHFRRTPMLHGMQTQLGLDPSIDLHLKLENTQFTGSYKVRGVINYFHHVPEGYGTEEKKLITISAGNYGKAFAYLTNFLGLKGLVMMPDTAPINKAKLIQNLGAEVEMLPSPELQPTVDKYVKEKNMLYAHSFDDVHLIAGHATLGLEILEDVDQPDIVLVCCGGGALLSGTAAALRLSGLQQCKIFGVEPEGARTMHDSFLKGEAVSMAVKTVASGLAPPYAGPNAFRHCKKHVDGILLVSDREILEAMFKLYQTGLLVEPSGAAAVAALLHGKVPDAKGKKIVAVITGGNVTPDELVKYSESIGKDWNRMYSSGRL